MNLRKTFLATTLLALASAASAHAQFSVYGTATVEHVTGIKCVSAPCGSNDGTISPIGANGGIFYDARTIGPVRLGIDLRGSDTIGNKSADSYFNTPKPRIYSALGGVRVSSRAPIFHLRPYAEGLVGFAKSNFTGTSSSSIQFRGVIGADIPIFPAVDFRVVELGAGSIRNSGTGYPVETISTGIVFHFPY